MTLISETELFAQYVLPFAFDPKAPPPVRWHQFLAELWEDDEESKEALSEWFGDVLAADTSQQKMYLLVGPKRSGKGTIARVLTGLLGAAQHDGADTRRPDPELRPASAHRKASGGHLGCPARVALGHNDRGRAAALDLGGGHDQRRSQVSRPVDRTAPNCAQMPHANRFHCQLCIVGES